MNQIKVQKQRFGNVTCISETHTDFLVAFEGIKVEPWLWYSLPFHTIWTAVWCSIKSFRVVQNMFMLILHAHEDSVLSSCAIAKFQVCQKIHKFGLQLWCSMGAIFSFSSFKSWVLFLPFFLLSQINWMYNAWSQLRRKGQYFLSIPRHQVIQIWSTFSAYFCFSSTQRLNLCLENMLCNALDMPIGGHLKLRILFPKPKITYSICNRSENWMLLNILAH